MGGGDETALRRLLGGPETDWLVQRVRARVLSAGGAPLSGQVRLARPSESQRNAAFALVGRPTRPGRSLTVDLARVEVVLRRGPWPAGLADAVITLTGPVEDTRAQRERREAAWAAAQDTLAPVLHRFPGLQDWWADWCRSGGLKRTGRAEAERTGQGHAESGHAESGRAESGRAGPDRMGPDPVEWNPAAATAAALVTAVVRIFESLPAGGVLLSVLARRVTGDAHGLDAGRPLGRLAVAVVGAAFVPGTRVGAREAWAAAGVELSNLSSTVLCLGVPGAPAAAPGDAGTTASGHTGITALGGTGALAAATSASVDALRAAAAPGYLTLDQVRSGGVAALPPGVTVFACENPSVVELVGARLAESGGGIRQAQPAGGGRGGVGVPTLVCTSGQPSTAVVELLRVLTARGAECRYHGDFDWAGLRIAGALSRHVDWRPWRFNAADYRAAVSAGGDSLSLSGPPTESPWDPDLARAMARHGLAVEEEAVIDLLADDVLQHAGTA